MFTTQDDGDTFPAFLKFMHTIAPYIYTACPHFFNRINGPDKVQNRDVLRRSPLGTLIDADEMMNLRTIIARFLSPTFAMHVENCFVGAISMYDAWSIGSGNCPRCMIRHPCRVPTLFCRVPTLFGKETWLANRIANAMFCHRCAS